jgi:hypothetical protein
MRARMGRGWKGDESGKGAADGEDEEKRIRKKLVLMYLTALV